MREDKRKDYSSMWHHRREIARADDERRTFAGSIAKEIVNGSFGWMVYSLPDYLEKRDKIESKLKEISISDIETGVYGILSKELSKENVPFDERLKNYVKDRYIKGLMPAT